MKGGERLMAEQQQAVVELVEAQRIQGRTVGEVLRGLAVSRSSYYRWKKGAAKANGHRQSSYEITAE